MHNQTHKGLKRARVAIHGMTCHSCEILIERKWKKIDGMVDVSVDHQNGTAELIYYRTPSLSELRSAVADTKYTITPIDGRYTGTARACTTFRDYAEVGGIFLIVLGMYLVGSKFHLIPGISVGDSLSYGLAFGIGLVAAVSSCIAVTGGILLAAAAKYAEGKPHLSGWQKFKPTIYFNSGRVVSYTVLGGLIGLVGAAFSPSPFLTGLIAIGASAVMIIVGFRLLNLFPKMGKFIPRMPKGITHLFQDASERHPKAAPFLLGASTFFLPCGFTQALQLYVLSKGDPVGGALIMFFFSLGTVPALLSLGALSSFVRGKVQHYFLKTAGVIILMLGLFNLNNGFALAGFQPTIAHLFQSAASGGSENTASVAPIVDGKQIIEMSVDGLSYNPAHFTVVQGVPVEWRVDGRKAEGCAQVLTSPSLNITQYLSLKGVATVSFTPSTTGTFPFFCPMAMTTPGAAITVIPNTVGTQAPTTDTAQGGAAQRPDAQKLAMTITREKGFSPKEFTAKSGKPIDLVVDAQAVPGGCMSVMVAPQYNTAMKIKAGENVLALPAAKAGDIDITCSMGSPIASIHVID